MTKGKQSELIALALGANVAGPWGSPLETIRTALRELSARGVRIVAASRVFHTPALGYSPQPDYLNAAILVRCSLTPAMLMRELKRIERRAGRRSGKPWGPRPLDLDLLYARGARSGSRRTRGTPTGHLARPLMLPHPELEKRAFVLVPLRDVAPHLRGLVSGRSVGQLVRALPRRAVNECRPLEKQALACDT